MPRKGVPYGGAICSLKERIAEIWDKLGEKLHSINGVEGDGAGNVEIVSGDAAVVINNDQIGHKIELSLDNSKLPAAAVSSVNGQTGAVVLNAGNIPTNGNANVQTDIDAEREARENADAALQTNIKAAWASIPEMSTTPDPYKGIERDAQGRAFAADPASGATDKTLVTANWVSQSGNTRPNNLIHQQGTESINGTKIFQSGLLGATIQLKTVDMHLGTPGTNNIYSNAIQWVDQEGNAICKLWVAQKPNGGFLLGIDIRKSDKTWSFGHPIYETN